MWLLLPALTEASKETVTAAVRAVAPGKPVPVKVGIKLQQITQVDQRAETFGVVATLMLEWRDRHLAYDSDSDPCKCQIKVLKEDKFDELITERGARWPEFTIFNQQGNRFTQNRAILITPDGTVTYFERFSTTLQAPDFNFRQFPFDTQEFFIHIDSLYPEVFFQFTDLEGFSEIATRLGNDGHSCGSLGHLFRAGLQQAD
jgi:hypothetical protein